MSLTFCDQHLAWQQRVFKEINAASRLYDSFQHYSSSRKTCKSSQSLSKKARGSSSVRPSRAKKISDSLKTSSLATSFMNPSFNVYAEVRGKYARPPPQLNQAVANPVLNRPATAGSLRPRSRGNSSEFKAFHSNNEKHEILNDQLYRPQSSLENSKQRKKSQRSNRYYKVAGSDNSPERLIEKSGEKEDGFKSYEKVGAKNEQRNLVNGYEKTEENGCVGEEKAEDASGNEEKEEAKNKEVQENFENFEEIGGEKVEDEKVKENRDQKSVSTSKASWKTTSSQRRYIQELENLLREEKLRRMKLEEVLTTLISK